MVFSPVRTVVGCLFLLATWIAASESSAEERPRLSLRGIDPPRTFLRQNLPSYRNYAFHPFENYPNHASPYEDTPKSFYGHTGDYLTTGYDLYNWLERRRQGQDYGSQIFKEELTWSDLFGSVVVGGDGYGSWNYSLVVGDALTARFTPLTLSMTDFSGMRLDGAVPYLKFTALASRIERPHFILPTGTSARAPWQREQGQFAEDSSLLLGGRLQAEVGRLRVGLNGVNLHVYNSTQPGNGLKGRLRPNQPLIDWILVRFADDSPADGRGGAAVQQVQLVVDGQVRPDIKAVVIRHIANVQSQVGRLSRITGAFSANGYEAVNYGNAGGGVIPQPLFFRGRDEIPVFADYLYRLDHANGIDVSGQTNLEGLVANLALESPDEVLRANGDEQLVYLFDVSREPHVAEVEVEALVGNDYRVEVATLYTANPSSTDYVRRFNSTFYGTVERAEGNVQDMSNLKSVRFRVGENTAIFTYSADVNLRLAGLEINGEYARSALYARYPARRSGEPLFDESPRFADRGSAYFVNATRWFGRWRLGGEYFSMNPDYRTSMRNFLRPDGGDLHPFSPINGVVNNTIYWDLVQDNEDGDAFPDKRIGKFLTSSIYDTRGVDPDGVYLSQDEDGDGFPDTNRNHNLEPDYDEPFLMYDVEPNEYVYGLDRNNNDEPDHREDDLDPDYPYDPDQRGFHLFGQMDLSRRWSATVGRHDVEEIAGAGRYKSTYAILTYRRNGLDRVRRLFFENHFRRVQDDIPDAYNSIVERRDFTQTQHSQYLRGGGILDFPVFPGRQRADPLLYKDSFVNETYLEGRLRPWSTFNVVQKLRLRVNWQQGGHLHGGLFQRDSRLDHWTTVSRVDYTWNLGALSVQPKFKFQLLRFVDQQRDLTIRWEFETIPIVQLSYPLLPRTTLGAGIQGIGPLPYRLEDRAHPSSSYDRRTTIITLANRSRYFGYDLTTIIGFVRDETNFDDRLRRTEGLNGMSIFVRALIGFPNFGALP